MDIVKHNKSAWDHYVDNNDPWTIFRPRIRKRKKWKLEYCFNTKEIRSS